MKFTKGDYDVHNNMEDIAEQAVRQVISEEDGVCDCPLCLADMMALVLNKLKPRYEPILENLNNKEISLDSLETELFNRIMIESYLAVVRIKANPRHADKRTELHNSAEDNVRLFLDEVLQQKEMTIDRAQLSIVMANVLNSLAPKYTTTPKGNVFSRTVEIDAGESAKIYAAIFYALGQLEAAVRERSS